jgi:signal transduction histidine kinase
MSFGWRGGLLAGLLAGISSLPYSLGLLKVMPAYAGDQLLDIVVFCGAGFFTGILANRDREQRASLERTTASLSAVNRKLQETFEQVKRAERLSAMGQLAAGLAHEIRNPLASVSGAAGLLKRETISRERREECVDIIQKECDRLNRLLSEFLDFARPRPPRFQPTDVGSVLRSVVDLAAHTAGEKGVRMIVDLPADLPPLECDPERITQAVLNLLINAITASEGSAAVTVTARAEKERITIQVRDQGAGIDPQLRDRIFDPFFTTKMNGTGLGLSVVHQIVEQHGGSIQALPNLPRGTNFNLSLPQRQGASS